MRQLRPSVLSARTAKPGCATAGVHVCASSATLCTRIFCHKRGLCDPQTASPGTVSLPWPDRGFRNSPRTGNGHSRIWMSDSQRPITPAHSTHRHKLHIRRYMSGPACCVRDLRLAHKQADGELQFPHHLHAGALCLGARTVCGHILRVPNKRTDRQLGAADPERARPSRYDLGHTDWLHLHLTGLLHAQPCAEHHDPIVTDCDFCVQALI